MEICNNRDRFLLYSCVSDADQVGTVPAGPDIIIDRIQPVAEGPVGQYSTRRPVGTDGMFSTSDSDEPTVYHTQPSGTRQNAFRV